MDEIILLSRGGQGGVTAAKIIANAALAEGKYSQAIPKYGAERRGAPVVVAIRISDEHIKLHSQVREANHIISFEPGLLANINPNQIAELHTVSLNAPEQLDLPFEFKGKMGYVDAISIGNEFGLKRSGIVVTSTIMTAIFAKTSGLIGLDALLDATQEMIKDKTTLEANINAIKAAYDRTTVVQI